MTDKIKLYQKKLSEKRDKLYQDAMFCKEHNFEHEYRVKFEAMQMVSDLLIQFEITFKL